MSYYTDPHRKKRSKRPFILFFLLLLSALLFFRDRIACEIINYYVGVKFIQNKDCPLDVTSITKDHGHLYLKEVCFENHEVSIFAEQVSVYTSIHFFPFSVTSYVDFKRPKVVLKNSNSENSKISLLYFIFPGKYLNLKWNVDSGSINVKNSKDDDLFFSYKTDQSQNFIGRFILEEKKEDQIISLCNLLLKSEDHILSADLHVNAGNLAIVQQYLPYLRLKDNLTADYLQGGLKLESSLVFNAKEKNIEQFSSQFFLSDFCLVSEKGSIACTIPESSGSFSYNKNEDKESLININKNISFWKNCNAHLKAQDFVFQSKKYSNILVKNATAEVFFSSTEDPKIFLNGNLLSDTQEIPFKINSTGLIHDDGSFWLESNCNFLTTKNSEAILSLCKVNDQEYVAQVDFSHIDSKIIHFFHSFTKLGFFDCIDSSTIAGSIITWIDHSSIRKIEWNNINSKDLLCRSSDQGILIKADNLCSNGSMVREDKKWKINNLALVVSNGCLSRGSSLVNSISCLVDYKDGVLLSSELRGAWNEGQISIISSGPVDQIQSTIDLKTSYTSFLSSFIQTAIPKNDVVVNGCFVSVLDANMLSVNGDLTLSSKNDGESKLTSSIKIPILRRGFFWEYEPDLSLIKANVKSEFIPDSMYRPIIQSRLSDIDLSGNIGVNIDLGYSKLIGTLSSDNLVCLYKKKMGISSGLLEHKTTSFSYDVENDSVFFDVVLNDGYYSDQLNSLNLSKINGRFVWQNEKLQAENITSVLEEVHVPFSMYYDNAGLFIRTLPISGEIQQFAKIDFVKKFVGPFIENMKGYLNLPSGGCSILMQKKGDDWGCHWKIGASVQQLTARISTDLFIENGFCDFNYDSSLSIANIKNTRGSIFAYSKELQFNLADLAFDPRKDSRFSFNVIDDKINILELNGFIKYTSEWNIVFDKDGCTFLAQPLLLANCKIARGMKLKELDISTKIQGENIADIYTCFYGSSLLSSSTFTKYKSYVQDISGSILLAINFNDIKGCTFQAAADGVYSSLFAINNLDLSGYYKDGRWKLEKCSWNDHAVYTEFITNDQQINVLLLKYLSPTLQFDLKGLYGINNRVFDVKSLHAIIDSSFLRINKYENLKGKVELDASGVCKLNENFLIDEMNLRSLFDIGINLPVICQMKQKKHSLLSFSSSKGCKITGLDFDIFIPTVKKNVGKFSIDSIVFSEKLSNSEVSYCDLTLLPEGSRYLCDSSIPYKDLLKLRTDLDWKLSCSLKSYDGLLSSKIKLNPGLYSLFDKEYQVESAEVLISSSQISLDAIVEYNNLPLHCYVEKGIVNESPVLISINEKDCSEILKLTCKPKNDSYEVVRVDGKLSGIQANLQKSSHISDGSFFGIINVNYSKAQRILPKDLVSILSCLKLGAGYTMQGHFFILDSADEPFTFQGNIKGEKCELLDYCFDSLQVKAHISKDKLIFEDFKIEDLAANLMLKSCQISKDQITHDWNLYLPLAHLREFKPSLLSEKGKRLGEKPFMIKNLTVYDFRGKLGDKKSFVGKGAIHFLNSNKKGFSLLDIPLDVIKDIGLDSSILVPVSGESEFDIRKGRCLFHELKNSYSDSRRSEFYLNPETLSYVDLDGNLHIDLRMRQHVLVKWSQSFIVCLRGSLSKPKYSLKNIDSGN